MNVRLPERIDPKGIDYEYIKIHSPNGQCYILDNCYSIRTCHSDNKTQTLEFGVDGNHFMPVIKILWDSLNNNEQILCEMSICEILKDEEIRIIIFKFNMKIEYINTLSTRYMPDNVNSPNNLGYMIRSKIINYTSMSLNRNIYKRKIQELYKNIKPNILKEIMSEIRTKKDNDKQYVSLPLYMGYGISKHIQAKLLSELLPELFVFINKNLDFHKQSDALYLKLDGSTMPDKDWNKMYNNIGKAKEKSDIREAYMKRNFIESINFYSNMSLVKSIRDGVIGAVIGYSFTFLI